MVIVACHKQGSKEVAPWWLQGAWQPLKGYVPAAETRQGALTSWALPPFALHFLAYKHKQVVRESGGNWGHPGGVAREIQGGCQSADTSHAHLTGLCRAKTNSPPNDHGLMHAAAAMPHSCDRAIICPLSCPKYYIAYYVGPQLKCTKPSPLVTPGQASPSCDLPSLSWRGGEVQVVDIVHQQLGWAFPPKVSASFPGKSFRKWAPGVGLQNCWTSGGGHQVWLLTWRRGGPLNYRNWASGGGLCTPIDEMHVPTIVNICTASHSTQSAHAGARLKLNNSSPRPNPPPPPPANPGPQSTLIELPAGA